MCKRIFILLLFFFSVRASGQDPISIIIKEGIKKVIVAVDLKIQRLQNKTVWLQNAQKTIENALSKLKLTEISDWVEKQRKLYDDYFQELWKVKAVLTYYQRVKDVLETSVALVRQYQSAWATFQQDHHFTSDELSNMERTYSGLLTASGHSIEQLELVINAFTTQMSDGQRMQLINQAADQITTA